LSAQILDSLQSGRSLDVAMVDLEAFAMIRNLYEIPIPSNQPYGEQMELLTVAKNGFAILLT